MDWPELESCYTGWPLPMASPISWKPLLQDRYLDEICTNDVKPRRWHTFLSVMVGGQQERTPKEERTHQKCHGSHQRIGKEEAEEEREIFLQDLSEVQPQHSGLLEESKKSIERYTGQCWCWRCWRGWNRNGLNNVVMLGWWRGQSNCLCLMYNVFHVRYLNRKRSNVWHLKG